MNYQKVVNFNSVVLFSEVLKEEDSAKTRSLQVLQDDNKKLTQELDSSRQGQSELLKVNRAHHRVMHKLNLLTLDFFFFLPTAQE